MTFAPDKPAIETPLDPDGSLPRNVKLLGAASLMNDIASEIIYPLLPEFLKKLGGTPFDLGVIEGVAESLSCFLKLGSGAWSDGAAQRKRFLVVGYSIAALIRPLIGLAMTPWQIFALRTVDRVGKGIRSAPRDALLADSTPKSMHGRAFGFHRAMDHLGAALGPVFASVFLMMWPDQLSTLFLLTVIPGLLVVAIVTLGLREPPPAIKTERPPFKLTLQPFGTNFRVFLLALVVFTLGNSSDMFLLHRAKELGVPTSMLPLLWCVFHIVKSGGNIVAGRFVDVVGSRPLIFAGWGLYAAIYMAFAFATQAWHVWILFLFYAVFYALTEPAEKAFVTSLVGKENKGLAFGWFNFAIGIAALPSSMIFGWLYVRYGPLVAFSWGAGLAALAALLLAFVQIPRNPIAESRA